LANGKVMPIPDSEAEEHLDPSGREALQKLRLEQAGVSFDRQYLQAQIGGHEMLLHVQDDYLNSGRNPEVLNVAKLARSMIKEHLQLLSDIGTEMGSGTTGAAPRPR
jgi:putative membrane protein